SFRLFPLREQLSLQILHFGCPAWLLPFFVTSTIRKRAFPAIIFAYAAGASSSWTVSIIADTLLSALKRRVAPPFAGLPVSDRASLRSPKRRSGRVISIGSAPTPTLMETPPGRRPLKVSATVLPPEAVTRMTLAPPSACRAAAGSVAALSI